MQRIPFVARLFVTLAPLLLASCRPTQTAGGPAAAPPPMEVQVATVTARDVPIVKEWVGTLDGLVNAEIRGQVTGYLMRQVYREGSFVRKGDLLFEIDPRPFQAALNEANGRLAQAESAVQQAEGNLAQSQARLGKTELDVKRYTPLVKTRAISQEEMDNAMQSRLEAQAAVETTRAAIATAKAAVVAARASVYDAEVKLGFTKIASPVDGIAGLATIQVGDLVSPSGTPLTAVSTVNPIKAYFTISEQEYLAQQRAGGPDRWAKNLELVLADGSVYGHKGAFFMADRQVDVGTGSLRVAALFPNPGNVLRPGQYGRVRAVMGVRKDAPVIPQRAVNELQGSYQVAVVDDGNKVTIRTVRMGERADGMWVVDEGLRPGERVIVEGLQKVRTGAVVNPKAAAAGPNGR
ncbi:MAG: efflux RND transporter periplasmic adaptor subunit [Acidobacteria bacterium]|nr:efflux RND transporter periplasmic adaptor subunit [Acidobacteriota bacterium]